MSTTVIASRHGAALYLAPWKPGQVDVVAVRAAAAAHGVDLFDAELLNTQPEAIVAAGLDVARAARFAAALREQGLTVRVVNDPKIHQSARLGNAIAALFLAGILLSPFVLPALLAWFNALFLLSAGTSLPLAGAPKEQPLLAMRALDRLRALELPAHILDPLVAKAEVLAQQAAAEPEGPADRALQELIADLDSDGAAQIAQTASTLRSELAMARRAARELG